MKRFNVQYVLRTYFSTSPKPVVTLDKKVTEELENKSYKPRRHPGLDQANCVELPSSIAKAITKSFKDVSIKDIQNHAQKFSRYLKGRHIPAEVNEISEKVKEIEEKLKRRKNVDESNEEEMKKLQNQVQNSLKKQVYMWKSIVYDNHKALQYLLARSAQEYSAIFRIFTEIKNRDQQFEPKSYFDFGSGVGTGIWAASNLWKKSIFEYYLVDSSSEMNDLADLILRDGEENKAMELKNVNFRQFLPATTDIKYDIVLSAYSLFELPNAKLRLETLLNLWNRCDGYLIIVEQGTLAGFKLITEARDFILYASRKTKTPGYVFAPCSHDAKCPRFVAQDGTPCNFPSLYKPITTENLSKPHTELFSYVVLKKSSKDDADSWPRIVRPTLIRTKHTICRMCTKNGKLEEVIFTQAKQGRLAYRCARSSSWGDRLPISIDTEV